MAGQPLNARTSTRRPAYLRIPLASLRTDSVTNFDVFVEPAGQSTVLYRSRDLAFTEDVRQRLTDSGVKYLHIRTADEEAYQTYLEENIPAILSDDTISVPDRCEILYYSAQNLVKEVFDEPRSGRMLGRSKKLVENTVNYLFAEDDAFLHLLKVTSFDYYTYTHSVNVFVFSVALAQRLGYSDANWLREFGDGALLHDIGKSLLDPSVVNCNGKLNDAQWAEMKRHPTCGFELLSEQGHLTQVALDVVLHHHEKLRGTGYPDCLNGDDIKPWVRICTICDIFDALTTNRSYKAALSSFAALRLMKNEMLPDLDRDIFYAFVDMMGHPTKR